MSHSKHIINTFIKYGDGDIPVNKTDISSWTVMIGGLPFLLDSKGSIFVRNRHQIQTSINN